VNGFLGGKAASSGSQFRIQAPWSQKHAGFRTPPGSSPHLSSSYIERVKQLWGQGKTLAEIDLALHDANFKNSVGQRWPKTTDQCVLKRIVRDLPQGVRSDAGVLPFVAAEGSRGGSGSSGEGGGGSEAGIVPYKGHASWRQISRSLMVATASRRG